MILATLLTALMPAQVAIDLYNRGSIPKKHVELVQGPAINPTRDLSALGDRVHLSLTVNDQTINNLVIIQTHFKNIGKSPIIPTDFYENLSVTVQNPWRIIAVENSRSLYVQLHWRRVSDTRFEAEPFLLNPGDFASVLVYLTNNELPDPFSSTEKPDPQIKWNARIVNLRRFYEPPGLFERDNIEYISLELYGWAVPFTIGAGVLFFSLYLHLLDRAGFLPRRGRWFIGLIVSSGLLSVASAGCIATYLFPGWIFETFGINHWLHTPPIVLHVIVVTFLYLNARGTSL